MHLQPLLRGSKVEDSIHSPLKDGSPANDQGSNPYDSADFGYDHW